MNNGIQFVLKELRGDADADLVGNLLPAMGYADHGQRISDLLRRLKCDFQQPVVEKVSNPNPRSIFHRRVLLSRLKRGVCEVSYVEETGTYFAKAGWKILAGSGALVNASMQVCI